MATKSYMVTYNKDGQDGIIEVTLEMGGINDFEAFQEAIKSAVLNAVGEPSIGIEIRSIVNSS